MDHRRKKIKQYIKESKQGKSCTKCFESDVRVLDYHHKDRSKKKASISEIPRLKWSIKKLQKEIDKCIILCSNCHRKEHNRV